MKVRRTGRAAALCAAALLCGCWMHEGATHDWGWSWGMDMTLPGSEMDMTVPGFGSLYLEMPIRDGGPRAHSLVAGTSLALVGSKFPNEGSDTVYPFPDWGPDAGFNAMGLVSYRRYFGKLDGYSEDSEEERKSALFWEAGVLFGRDYNAWYEEADTSWYWDSTDAFHPFLGAGIRGGIGLYFDLSARVLPGTAPDMPLDVRVAFLMGVGWGESEVLGRPGGSSWTVESSGPRGGIVFLTGPAAEIMEAQGQSPLFSVWGWQFELQYQGSPDGPTGLVEFVPMIAGLEQGESHGVANVLFGVRTPEGLEFAAGPYLSPNGLGLTVAAGKTFCAGAMNLPVNFAVTTNERGTRYSLTFGWNM